MILTRAAFISGFIFAAAVIASLARRSQYETVRDWWNAEGFWVWMIAGMLGVGLLLSSR